MGSSVSYPTAGTPGRRLSLSLGTVVAFVAVDVLLVAACLLALRQIARLRVEVAGAYSLLAPANGTLLPMLVGQDWTGALQAISYESDQRHTLIYTFTKNCGSCQENWRAMKPFQARRERMIYIDTDDDKFTTQYLSESGIGRSVILVKLSPGSEAAYDARAVPRLLLVNHDGRVQWSHVGALASGDVSKALSLIEHN
jgi:hypothetical protein